MKGKPLVSRPLPILTAAFIVLLFLPDPHLLAGGEPTASEGEIRFVVDAASFQREEGSAREEIYLLIPNEDLRYEESAGERFEAEIEVRFEICSWPTGEPLLERKIGAVLRRGGGADEERDLQILQHDFRVPEGGYRMVVEIEDRKTLGFGFFRLFGRSSKKGKAVCYFHARHFRNDGVEVSDIQFARLIDEKEGGEFEKGKYEVLPQPNRLYGILLARLPFYYEIYDMGERRDPGGEPYRVRHQVIDGEGKIRIEEEQALSATGLGRRFRRTGGFEAADLPAGNYDLRVTVESPARAETAFARGSFSVLWKGSDVARIARKQKTRWDYGDRTGDDVIEEMVTVLSQGELELLKQMTPAGRREWIDRYWKDRDPTGETERNELREEHYRRIRIANTRFGSIRLKGLETDRGRIYIRYGEPDEIRAGYADSEFVPGSLTLPGERSGIGSGGRGRGGFNMQDKQYEVWTYTERGRILGDRGKVSGGLGMRFVFVDVEGYGNFHLVESSEGGHF